MSAQKTDSISLFRCPATDPEVLLLIKKSRPFKKPLDRFKGFLVSNDSFGLITIYQPE